MNYKIIWADDEIDALLDFRREDLLDEGIEALEARTAKELETLLHDNKDIDAVILDANFSASSSTVKSERETTGLEYASFLYRSTLKKAIPFFLYSKRSEELLKREYEDRANDLLDDFPRHKRWFVKGSEKEFKSMVAELKKAVTENNDPSAVIRRRYEKELAAASAVDKLKHDESQSVYELISEFLMRDHEGTLAECVEPFVGARRTVEKVFSLCENYGLMPPISSQLNGIPSYFMNGKYEDKEAKKNYEVIGNNNLMEKPVASALFYIMRIIQDGSHSKGCLQLRVDDYFKNTKDVYLLKSVYYVLIDILLWFARTIVEHPQKEANMTILWMEVK